MTMYKPWLERLASVKLTLVCLALAMILIVCGTLAQVHMGTFAAQKEYFNSWWLFTKVGDSRLPVFPGGLSIGAAWMVNLLAAFAVKFNFRRQDAGLLISHLGVILLLLGQFLTQTLAHESTMPIRIGESRHYTETIHETELVLIKSVPGDLDEVTAIPSTVLARREEIHSPHLPFYLVVRRFIKNAQLGMQEPGAPTLATQGIGTRVGVKERPPVSSDDEVNTTAVFVEVKDSAQSLGVWLVSSGLGAPQQFRVGGDTYHLSIRPRRFYLPFTLTLKEFHHEVYPGTTIPKNFSSLVHLSHPEKKEERDALLYMNHPLRYGGKTFYQASFGENDRLSVFQVVDNPAAIAPYISCSLVILGLLIQFMSHLLEFLRKKP